VLYRESRRGRQEDAGTEMWHANGEIAIIAPLRGGACLAVENGPSAAKHTATL